MPVSGSTALEMEVGTEGVSYPLSPRGGDGVFDLDKFVNSARKTFLIQTMV